MAVSFKVQETYPPFFWYLDFFLWIGSWSCFYTEDAFLTHHSWWIWGTQWFQDCQLSHVHRVVRLSIDLTQANACFTVSQHFMTSFRSQRVLGGKKPLLFRRQLKHMGVSENSGTSKSSILIGFSIFNYPFWGTPIFGNTHIENPTTLMKLRPFPHWKSNKNDHTFPDSVKLQTSFVFVGQEVEAVFGFCSIRNFGDATDVLKEKASDFTQTVWKGGGFNLKSCWTLQSGKSNIAIAGKWTLWLSRCISY